MRRHLLFILAALLPCSAASARLVAITPQQVQRLGIRTAPVRVASTQTTISVLGRIAPAPASRIPVSAPFAGALVQLVRLEGESVKQGDALAVIASADMHAALAKLQGQEAHYRSAKAAAERARLLVSEGIAPASRAEEANAQAAAAEAEVAASRTVMARVGHSAGGGYQLLAPAAGRIAAIEVSAGEQVAAMQPVVSIDTRQELWVEGALPSSAIGQVAAGDGVVLEGMPGVTGTVTAAGTSIDPQRRAATVRARLNASAALVSGQTVRLSIQRKAQAGTFQVPRAAVVELKSGPVTFVARPGGFEPVAVRVLARGLQEATIQGRIGSRDSVAISGVSELKAASSQD